MMMTSDKVNEASLGQVGCYLISLTPGEAYISSWRDPLRRRNSMAEKSLLSTLMFFSNSVLHPD